MRFFHRYHKPIALIVLAALLVATTASPVSADCSSGASCKESAMANAQSRVRWVRMG